MAPDLAPVFAETPWLDIPPSPEGQADLLSCLQCIKPGDWQTALERLQPAHAATRPRSALTSPQKTSPPCLDPRRFLLDVMGDDTVSLALRIEAAKALLPYTDPCR